MAENFERKIDTDTEEIKYGAGEFVIEIVKMFLLALVVIAPIRVFLFQPFFVQGASMDPSFEDGEYLVINELGYKKTDVGIDGMNLFSVGAFKELARSDVVVFRYPLNPKQYFIKRIIGLPEEEVKISGGKVIIYNKENPGGMILDESAYLPKEIFTAPPAGISEKDFSAKLGEDEYFVMGDNRRYSSDSRYWGPVSKDKIIGRVILRAWPLEKSKLFL